MTQDVKLWGKAIACCAKEPEGENGHVEREDELQRRKGDMP